jgi:hypothetical protein
MAVMLLSSKADGEYRHVIKEGDSEYRVITQQGKGEFCDVV